MWTRSVDALFFRRLPYPHRHRRSRGPSHPSSSTKRTLPTAEPTPVTDRVPRGCATDPMERSSRFRTAHGRHDRGSPLPNSLQVFRVVRNREHKRTSPRDVASSLAFDSLVDNFYCFDRDPLLTSVETRPPPPGDPPTVKAPTRSLIASRRKAHNTPISRVALPIPIQQTWIRVESSLESKRCPLSIVGKEPRCARAPLGHGQIARSPTQSVAARKADTGEASHLDPKITSYQRFHSCCVTRFALARDEADSN